VAAVLHPRVNRLYAAVGRLGRRPFVFFAALVALSAMAYLPMAAAVSPFHWASFGPFYVQSSRVLLYALYFFVGIALGSQGTENGLFSRDERLARRWPLWATAALLAFAANLVVFVVGVLPTLEKGGPGLAVISLSAFAFVLTCAAASLACIAFFVRFARVPNRVMDSLSANAFGIYLTHYFCVSWLQYALLGVALPGAAKGTIVFVGASLLSWALSAAVRRFVFRKPAAAEMVAATV
jgi:surface polysaccharide O-acyltransferase-like enzyme